MCAYASLRGMKTGCPVTNTDPTSNCASNTVQLRARPEASLPHHTKKATKWARSLPGLRAAHPEAHSPHPTLSLVQAAFQPPYTPPATGTPTHSHKHHYIKRSTEAHAPPQSTDTRPCNHTQSRTPASFPGNAGCGPAPGRSVQPVLSAPRASTTAPVRDAVQAVLVISKPHTITASICYSYRVMLHPTLPCNAGSLAPTGLPAPSVSCACPRPAQPAPSRQRSNESRTSFPHAAMQPATRSRRSIRASSDPQPCHTRKRHTAGPATGARASLSPHFGIIRSAPAGGLPLTGLLIRTRHTSAHDPV